MNFSWLVVYHPTILQKLYPPPSIMKEKKKKMKRKEKENISN